MDTNYPKSFKAGKAIALVAALGVLLLVTPIMSGVKGISHMLSKDSITYGQLAKAITYGIGDEISLVFAKKGPESNDPKTELSLEIDQINLRHFYGLVRKARSQDVLTKKTKDWVPAKLHADGKTYEAKFRLRGDVSNHYSGSKISLRIKIKGQDLWQMRKDINLIIPQDRKYFIDVLLSDIAALFSLPNNKADIVHLKMNGADIGSYVLLERYDKVLLERQNQPFSSVFKLDEAAFVSFDEEKDKQSIREYSYSQDIVYSPAMWKSRTDPEGNIEEHRAILGNVFSLITQEGILSHEDYKLLEHTLNVDAYSWASAFNVLFSAHMDAPHNALIYYDNVTGQFKPLMADPDFLALDLGKLDDGNDIYNFQVILNKLVTNSLFMQERNNKLSLLVERQEEILSLLDNVFYKSRKYYVTDGLLPANSTLKNKFLSYRMNGPALRLIYYEQRNSLKNKFKLIEDYITSSKYNSSIPKQENKDYENPLVVADLAREDNKVTISTKHNQNKNLIIKSIYIEQKTHKDLSAYSVSPSLVTQEKELRNAILEDADDDNISWGIDGLNIFLPPSKDTSLTIFSERADNIKKIILSIQSEDGIKLSNSRIVSRFMDAENLNLIKKIHVIEKIFKNNSNIDVSIVNRKITIVPGDYQVYMTIVIPRGYELTIPRGTTFRFNPDTWFVSYSPVNVIGTAIDPVKFIPYNEKENWNGFLVFQTNQYSSHRNIIDNLIVMGGKSGNFNGISVTGAVLFAESDVTITNSKFYAAGLDDSINIKRSDVILENNIFFNSTSDAVDIDWGTGRVKQNYILNAGGDGIDVSGSTKLILKQNLITFCEDKGISVGENSNIKADYNIIIGNRYGAVSKDLSILNSNDNLFIGNQFGMAAYQKKNFFGRGTIKSRDDVFSDNNINIDKDNLSEIYHEGMVIKTYNFDRNIRNSNLDTLNWLSKLNIPSVIKLPIEKWKEQVVQN